MRVLTLVLIVVCILIVGAAALLALLINMVIPETFYTEKRGSWEGAYENQQLQLTLPSDNFTITTPTTVITTKKPAARKLSEPSRKYPFLVSVSVPLYLDDLDTYIFTCTGVIVDSSHFLSGTVCMHHYDDSDMKQFAVVRSGSGQISTHGTEHYVVDLIQWNRLVLFKVSPEFEYEGIEVYSGQEPQTEFLSVGWENKIPVDETLSRTQWYSMSNEKCNYSDIITGSWGPTRPDIDLNGKPLITAKTKQLVGIEYEHDEDSDEPYYFKRYNLEMATLTGQLNETNYNIKHLTEELCSPII